jgi:hypothetical protein
MCSGAHKRRDCPWFKKNAIKALAANSISEAKKV